MKRYTEIHSVNKPLFTNNAPVVVEKTAVFHDSVQKRRVVLNKIKNLSEKTIKSVCALLQFYDTSNKKIGDGLAYEYLDLCVGQGETFGEKVLIKTNIPGVCKSITTVTEVTFDDGSVWTPAPDDKWGFIKLPPLIESGLPSPYHALAYKEKFGENAKFTYENRNGFQICTCGSINAPHSRACKNCGIAFTELINYDLDELKRDGAYLSAKNALSKKSNEKQLLQIRRVLEKLGDYKNSADLISQVDNNLDAIKNRRKRAKKLTIRWSSIAAAFATVTVLTFTVFVPWGRMLKADEYFKEDNLSKALSIYDDIGGFGHSEKNAAAIRAIYFLENDKVEMAIEKLLEAGVPVTIKYDKNLGNSKLSSNEFNSITLLSDSSVVASNELLTENYDDLEDFVKLLIQTKAGYNLEAWNYVSHKFDPTEKNSRFTIELKATWQASDYTITYQDTALNSSINVTYNYNYGENETYTVYLNDGITLTPHNPKERDGYVFTGWYTNAECTSRYDFTGKITDDLTLYAAWKQMSMPDAYTHIDIDATLYTSSSDYYSVSIDNTTSASQYHIYAVTEKAGSHTIYHRASTSNGYHIKIYNMTAEKIIKEVNSSAYAYQSINFNSSAGDVIVISIYSYNNDYYSSPTAYLYFEDFNPLTSTAYAELDVNKPYVYESGKSIDQTVKFDAPFTLIDVSRKGYNFLGWYDEDGNKVDSDIWKTPSSISLTPKWEGRNYTVTLDANGGTVSKKTVNAVYQESISLPTPKKDGYTFVGWFVGNKKYEGGDTWTTLADVTLVAHWTANTYTVTYENTTEKTFTVYFDYNMDVSMVALDTLKSGETLKYPDVPTRSGYAFAGWYKDSACTTPFNFSGSITEDTTFYAKWVAMTSSYTSREYVDISNHDSSSNQKSVTISASSSSKQNYYYFTCYKSGTYKIAAALTSGDFYITAYNVTKGSYIINKYNMYSSYSSKSATFTADAGDVIYVSFYNYNISGSYSKCTFYVENAGYPESTATCLPGQFIYSDNDSYSTEVTYGEQFTLPVPQRAGHIFRGWYNGNEKVESGTWSKYSNITLTPKWD